MNHCDDKSFQMGDVVSYLNEHGGLILGQIKGVDEGTPDIPLVVEFDDGTTRHFSLQGSYRGRSIKLIKRETK